MVEPRKLVQQFKNDLLGLTDNDKFKINALTIFSKDYKDNADVAEGVSEAASENVLNSRDANLRVKLYKLRTTWKEIFSSDELYELDLRVRANDPAWPNLVSLEKKSKISSLNPVPKLSKEKVLENESLPDPPPVLPNKESVVTISSGRDPRLKRKSSPTSSPSEGFLIDRDGDVKMEKIARKQGRKELVNEKQDNPKKIEVKENNKGSMWSNYFDKNTELCSRKDSKDIDLRVGGNTMKPNEIEREIPNKMMKYDQPPSNNHTGGPRGPEPYMHQMQPPMEPYSRDHQMRMGPHPVDRRMFPAINIRGPHWNVEIEGFPDMIQIGIDPRMLCKIMHPKPPRPINIDRCQYPLILDRVQPLVNIADRMHAVRFRCNSVDVIIEGKRFTIPGTGFKVIDFGMGKLTVYLGGPGHEIVIDGRPHTVPMNHQLSYVNLKGRMIGIQFSGNLPTTVNVLPPIPLQFLNWARDMLFGAPNNLARAPKNPLKQIQRMIENEQSDRSNANNKSNSQPSSDAQPIESENSAPLSIQDVSNKVDVHDLFSKLVAAGIVNNSAKKLPLLKDFSWNTFKVPNQTEIDALFSGYQCVLCGLRFEDEKSQAYAAHLDYHYVKNANNQSTEQKSQSWYQHYRFWLRGEMSNEGAGEFSTVVQDEEEIPKCHAFSDLSKNVCAVCMEKFDTYWDQAEEDWMIQGAVLSEDKLYHPICQDDAGKQFTQNNSMLRRHEESLDVTETSIKGEHEENTIKKEEQDPESVKEEKPDTDINEISNKETEYNVEVKVEPTCSPKPSPSDATQYIPSKSDISQDPLAALQKVLGMPVIP